MNLKEYREEPDKGLFEKIERRVRRRHILREGGIVVSGVAIVGIAIGLSLGYREESGKWKVEKSLTENLMETEQPSIQALEQPSNQFVKQSENQSISQTDKPVSQSVPSAHKVAIPEPMPETTQPVLQQGIPTLPSSDVRQASVAVDDLIVEETPKPVAESAAKNESTDTVQKHNYSILKAPNIIIPNGEWDENREFRVTATATVSDFSMVIFNRAGRRVFSTNDMLQPWDGIYNGVPVPQGAYVWVARFRDSEGRPHEEKGTVTVVR